MLGIFTEICPDDIALHMYILYKATEITEFMVSAEGFEPSTL